MLQINEWKAAAQLGLLPDEENPLFVFSLTNKDLLVQILSGTIDVKELARFELRCRGYDDNGRFVGFNA